MGAGEAGFAHSYSIPSVPVNLANDVDYKTYLSEGNINSQKSTHIVVPQTAETPNGANCLVIDLPPGACSAMHRTVSIDFSICVIGTIVHELDSGETVTLKPGVRGPFPRVVLGWMSERLTLNQGPHCAKRYESPVA